MYVITQISFMVHFYSFEVRCKPLRLPHVVRERASFSERYQTTSKLEGDDEGKPLIYSLL